MVDVDEPGEALDKDLDIRDAIDMRESGDTVEAVEAGEDGEAGEVGDVARIATKPVAGLVDRDLDGDVAG